MLVIYLKIKEKWTNMGITTKEKAANVMKLDNMKIVR